MSALTTGMIFDNGEYFVANLDNGGVRMGMNGEASVDFPVSHDNYATTVALGKSGNAESIEEAFDASYMAFLQTLGA